MTRTALAAALTAKQIAGAGLDVWEDEPPPSDHPLLQFDNVVVSPHTAGITRQSRHNIARIAAEQMLDILDGKKPPRLLNPEVWGTYSDRFARSQVSNRKAEPMSPGVRFFACGSCDQNDKQSSCTWFSFIYSSYVPPSKQFAGWRSSHSFAVSISSLPTV